MICGSITGQKLRIAQPLIVAGTIDYLEAEFQFRTPDWDGLSKWAHFQLGDTVYDLCLVNDRITRDQHLNLSAGIWSVYLHGTSKDGMRITTEPQPITVYQTGTDEGKPPMEIPPSAAEQIEQIAHEAETLAQSVRDDADAGMFQGGYYIPSIVNGKLHFTPSKSDMPSVPDAPLDIVDGEAYEGSYEVMPDATNSTVLETRGKILVDNVTVHNIPKTSVGNAAGGNTIYIGEIQNGRK